MFKKHLLVLLSLSDLNYESISLNLSELLTGLYMFTSIATRKCTVPGEYEHIPIYTDIQW